MTRYRMLARVKAGGRIREVGEVVALPDDVAAELLAHLPPYAELPGKKKKGGEHTGAVEGPEGPEQDSEPEQE